MPEVKQKWSQSLNGQKWAFDVTVNGTRIRRSNFETREDAEAALGVIESYEMDDDRLVGGTVKIHSVGAIAELVVCADLLRHGYDVFRSMSANAACDVIAGTDDGRLCRIEVKSAVKRDGRTRYKRHHFDGTKHDILALVFLREGRIEYSVDPHEWFNRENSSSI